MVSEIINIDRNEIVKLDIFESKVEVTYLLDMYCVFYVYNDF